MAATTLRRRLTVGGLGLGAGLLMAAGAWALPPGGAVDDPGTPPATFTIITPEVPVNGAVRFSGTGWLNQDGKGQSVMIKFDDFGNNGIGPFVADAQGNLEGSISLTPPAGATARQRADYAPADLNRADTSHWLRVLAGPWGTLPRNGPPRSLHGEFRVVAAAEETTPTTPAPTDPGGPTTPTTPVTPTTPGETAPTPARAAVILPGALRASGRRVAIRLRGGTHAGRVTVTLRSAARVRLAPRARTARVHTLGRAGGSLAASVRRPLRVTLTPAARRLLTRVGTLRVRVTLTRPGAAPTHRVLTLRG